MKIFGNNGNQEDKKRPRAPKTNHPAASKTNLPAVPKASAPAPGPRAPASGQKKPPAHKKSADKSTKLLVLFAALLVVAAIGITTYAVWTTLVRAPKAPTTLPENDSTIINNKDGDQVTVTETGDRVADYFTFVVGAVDEDETRTDALMLVGFDTKNKKVNILNIPRDTMSDVSRRGAAKKINAAYGTKKGIEQTKTEIKMLSGFMPDYYIIVNFQGIADIVDAIGGVDYEVPFRMYYKDPTQNLSIDFKPGMTHMDGQQVVEFLRWRKNNGGVKTGDSHYTGGDEERIAKQQEFLKYLATQILSSSNVTKIPAIAKAVFNNVKTDFTMGEMLWMGMQAVGLDSESLQMHTLPGYSAYSYAGTGTAYSFFFPYENETLALINEYFNPYVNRLTNLDIVSGPDKRGNSDSGSSNKTPTTREPRQTETRTEPTTENSDPEGSTTIEDNTSDSTSGTSDVTQDTTQTEGVTSPSTEAPTTQAQTEPTTEASAPVTTVEVPATPSTTGTTSAPEAPTTPASDPEA